MINRGLLVLMFLGIAGCNTEVSVETQNGTDFEAGHDYVLVHATAAEAKKNPLTGDVQALWLRHDPSYANVVINNGKRSWDRPSEDGLLWGSEVVVVPAGVEIRIRSIHLQEGESASDVLIDAQVQSGPYKGASVDVRNVCNAFLRPIEGHSGVWWVYVMNAAYLKEGPE